MQQSKIGFIGGGNMATSLIGGLISDGFPAQMIWVSDPSEQRREELAAHYGVHTGTDNGELVNGVEVLVLAAKPQQIHTICEEIAESVRGRRPLIVSIAAGVRVADLDRWLGGDNAVVRTMPNTPAMVQSGATALYANARVSEAQRELAENILRAVGLTVWLDEESMMDAVTAVSGSGPAYFFLLIEMLEQAGTNLGLEADTARLLALQTAFGAAKMALESEHDAASLRAQVTSPGGTTERAIDTLEAGQIRQLFSQAVGAARQRAHELAEQMGEQ